MIFFYFCNLGNCVSKFMISKVKLEPQKWDLIMNELWANTRFSKLLEFIMVQGKYTHSINIVFIVSWILLLFHSVWIWFIVLFTYYCTHQNTAKKNESKYLLVAKWWDAFLARFFTALRHSFSKPISARWTIIIRINQMCTMLWQYQDGKKYIIIDETQFEIAMKFKSGKLKIFTFGRSHDKMVASSADILRSI